MNWDRLFSSRNKDNENVRYLGYFSFKGVLYVIT